MQTTETQQKTSANGHELRCRCEECKTSIVEQFKPFKCMAWDKRFVNATETCECGRQVWGRGRGGFIVWSCWSCNAKRGRVVKVIDGGEDKIFGFAINEEGQTVYFHLTRQTTIQPVDGSDYPEMYDMAGTPVVPRTDDVILYAELRGAKGPKALWWAFESEYTYAKEVIANRKTYRLRWRQGREKVSKLMEAPVMNTLWEGMDLFELRKNHGKRVLFSEMYEAVYFEELKVVDGVPTWELCEDPR
jgi:hypothetical protein